MAWTWTVITVTNTGPDGLDLSTTGEFFATVEVKDDAGTVVGIRSYQLPHTVDGPAVIARVSADVARMRDARARVAGLLGQVGTVRTVT